MSCPLAQDKGIRRGISVKVTLGLPTISMYFAEAAVVRICLSSRCWSG